MKRHIRVVLEVREMDGFWGVIIINYVCTVFQVFWQV